MAGCEIVFQVEIDEYCQKLLQLRYPDAKRYTDIRKVRGSEIPDCDIITGGFPCQPFSVAGKQDGTGDNRYLWPEMSRIISEVKPSWVIAENVPGIIYIALDDVLDDLESKGYETITLVFPAHAFGAHHRRDRIWIVANSKGNGRESRRTELKGQQGLSSTCKNPSRSWNDGPEELMADTIVDGSIGRMAIPGEAEGRRSYAETSGRSWWQSEPRVGRVVNGCPNRVDRLKCLGNGQVSFCTRWIAENILAVERGEASLK